MKSIVKAIALIAGIAVTSAHAAQQDDDLKESSAPTASSWQIIKKDKLHGITTYYKHEDNKKLRSFKTDIVYENSFDAVACQILDIDNYPHWYMNVVESRILKKVSNTELYIYLKIKAPLGVPPRDLITHIVIQPYNKKRGSLAIEFSAAPDYLPEVPGVTRIPVYELALRYTPLENGMTREEGEGYAEPGGASMPSWLINYFQRNMPYNSAVARVRDVPNYENGKRPCQFTYKEE
jgi:hypothetical protein